MIFTGWVVAYFTMLSVFQISGMICEQRIGNCPEVYLNKPQNTSEKTACIVAETQTKHLLTVNIEWYRYASLLGAEPMLCFFFKSKNVNRIKTTIVLNDLS
jgi:hypothetical protein